MKSFIALFALIVLFMTAQAFKLSTGQGETAEVIDLSGFTDEDWDQLAEKLFGMDDNTVARMQTEGRNIFRRAGQIAKKIIC